MRGSALSKRKNFFSYINYMKDVESMEASLTDQEGRSILEDKKIEKELVQFYKDVYDAALFENATTIQEEENIPKINDIEKELLIQELTMDEMLMVIKETKTANKSAGLSNIPPEFIKWASYEMKEYIFDWICHMWREEITPVESGKSTITMLHKKGDKSKIKNYRTLSVGCNVCKVFLKLIEKRMSKAVENCGLLGELQNGFRKGRSCHDNILVLDTIIELAKAKNKPLFAAFLDITKAYDRVDREILWAKLQAMNMPEKLINIIKDVYKCPVGKMNFQGITTEWLDMPIGLKQGCVLSPLLFALYLADLVKEVEKYGRGPKLNETIVPMILFADDIIVMGSREQVLFNLELIAKFAEKNAIEFSGPKSMVVPFTCKTDKERLWPMGAITRKDGRKEQIYIKEVDQAKYLGITFSKISQYIVNSWKCRWEKRRK